MRAGAVHSARSEARLRWTQVCGAPSSRCEGRGVDERDERFEERFPFAEKGVVRGLAAGGDGERRSRTEHDVVGPRQAVFDDVEGAVQDELDGEEVDG